MEPVEWRQWNKVDSASFGAAVDGGIMIRWNVAARDFETAEAFRTWDGQNSLPSLLLQFPLLPAPPLSSLSFPSVRTRPLNPARRFGKRCKLPQRVRAELARCIFSSVATGGHTPLPSTGMVTGFVQIRGDFLGGGKGGGSDSSPQIS